MGNQNRKAGKRELERARRVIAAACPGLEPVFGAHGDYGGHRAPRDHTLAFRLRDAAGRYRSNVVWLQPDQLAGLDEATVRALVKRAQGR